jgi:hypothetical protein
MSSRTDALRGFQSFRTPNTIHPMDPALIPPKRYCGCGTVLARGNYGTLCAACLGPVEFPEWALALAENMGPVQLEHLGRILTGEESRGGEIAKTRALYKSIRAYYAQGMSQCELARAFGMTRRNVQYIVDHAHSVPRSDYEGIAAQKRRGRPNKNCAVLSSK